MNESEEHSGQARDNTTNPSNQKNIQITLNLAFSFDHEGSFHMKRCSLAQDIPDVKNVNNLFEGQSHYMKVAVTQDAKREDNISSHQVPSAVGSHRPSTSSAARDTSSTIPKTSNAPEKRFSSRNDAPYTADVHRQSCTSADSEPISTIPKAKYSRKPRFTSRNDAPSSPDVHPHSSASFARDPSSTIPKTSIAPEQKFTSRNDAPSAADVHRQSNATASRFTNPMNAREDRYNSSRTQNTQPLIRRDVYPIDSDGEDYRVENTNNFHDLPGRNRLVPVDGIREDQAHDNTVEKKPPVLPTAEEVSCINERARKKAAFKKRGLTLGLDDISIGSMSDRQNDFSSAAPSTFATTANSLDHKNHREVSKPSPTMKNFEHPPSPPPRRRKPASSNQHSPDVGAGGNSPTLSSLTPGNFSEEEMKNNIRRVQMIVPKFQDNISKWKVVPADGVKLDTCYIGKYVDGKFARCLVRGIKDGLAYVLFIDNDKAAQTRAIPLDELRIISSSALHVNPAMANVQVANFAQR